MRAAISVLTSATRVRSASTKAMSTSTRPAWTRSVSASNRAALASLRASARSSVNSHRVDLVSLRQGQHLAPFRAVELHARGGLLVDADDLVARPLCETRKVPFLAAGELASYAARRQTRQEQLDGQRETFGLRIYGADEVREVSAWLLLVALATTDIPGIAAVLMDEFRRRRIVAPGPTVIERLIAAVLVSAERHVTEQLTRGLSPRRMEALDRLLASDEGAAPSLLAWARQLPFRGFPFLGENKRRSLTPVYPMLKPLLSLNNRHFRWSPDWRRS